MFANVELRKEWAVRVARARLLESAGLECFLCGGTGAWPYLQHLKICVPCNGTGKRSTETLK